MKVISDDIKKGEFKSVYLLYGEEEYLKKQYRDRLKIIHIMIQIMPVLRI